MRMNPDVKAKWVEALRSGEYKQGKGQMHNREENSYCCLGVLCDLAVKSGAWVIVENDGPSYVMYDGLGGSLPPSVEQWAGLGTSDPALAPADRDEEDPDGEEYWQEASILNDSGLPFSQIADLIEWGL